MTSVLHIIVRSFFFLPICIIAIPALTQAQFNDSALAKLIVNQRQLYELNPQEFCFSHTDKQFYQPGETVFFQSYLFLTGRTISLSNVLYTDLSNEKGTLLMKAMWKAENGTANGHFTLPDTLTTGLYRIRSYSLWMLNHPSSIHEQFIFVLGKKDQHKSFLPAPSEINALLYPEGGQLLAGVANRLAIRIQDQNGLFPAAVKATLLNEKNELVASPLLYESGVGLFEFTPEMGITYFLEVQLPDAAAKRFPVPIAVQDGATLHVSNFTDTKIFVQVKASDSFVAQHSRVLLVAQQNGTTVLVQPLELGDMQNAIMIPKKGVAEGLLQVALFSSTWQPVAERWIWVQHPDTTSIQVIADTISTTAKGKNTYRIQVKGFQHPKLSVSVVPADLPATGFLSCPDAAAYSQVHALHNGKFFVQNQFRNQKKEERNLYLDALFLTLQPNRFTWSQIEKNIQPPLHYFFETGISVRGILKKEKTELDSGRVEMITKGADSSTIFSSVTVDATGVFAVNDLHFRKSASVFIQAKTKDNKKRKLNFELKPGYLDTLTGPLAVPVFQPKLQAYSNTEANSFIQSYAVSGLGKELKEIIITGKDKQQLRLDSLSKALASDMFRESELTKEPNPNFGYISFAQLFEQEFFGLRFNTGFDRITVEGGTPATGLASGDLISYYLNEIPITAEELNFINPLEVVLVKVNRNTNLHLGQLGPGPSVLIYTKRKYYGNLGMNASNILGYSIPFAFHSPDYTKNEYVQTEDRRTTLLWIPQLKLEANGTATISFYNNDHAKAFKLVIQGFDETGKPVVYETIVK